MSSTSEGQYQPNMACSWTVKTSPDKRIVLQVSDFVLSLVVNVYTACIKIIFNWSTPCDFIKVNAFVTSDKRCRYYDVTLFRQNIRKVLVEKS